MIYKFLLTSSKTMNPIDELWKSCKSQDIQNVVSKLAVTGISPCGRSNISGGSLDELFMHVGIVYQIAIFSKYKLCDCTQWGPCKKYPYVNDMYDVSVTSDKCVLENVVIVCVGYSSLNDEYIYREFGDVVINDKFFNRLPIEELMIQRHFQNTKIMFNGYKEYYQKCMRIMKYLGLDNIYCILVKLEKLIDITDVENLVYN